MASKGHLDDVRRNVMVVSELVDILGGEQKYLRRKLDRHILTVVSRWGGGLVGILVARSTDTSTGSEVCRRQYIVLRKALQ